ncbi:hypothetical protein GCM10008015_05690 [Flavobacterium palustre]|uniref:Lipoprotein n=1 Tax=Flavobacterium palustre TaxID=1476463 RepID=A0ABQ1HB32_9FLAO|nr:hypothetical protein [Flavobacterium palustre]GGA67792.1 hypothetical protein GCM10008015_05690 [Flavobacterium palustre]
MKSLIKLFSLVLVTFFIACSSDDSNQNTNNQGALTMGDQTVNLTQGYIENYGKVGNAYNIDFTVRSETLSGAGETSAVVYFELLTSTDKKLAVGTYNLGEFSEGTPFTFTSWSESILGLNITSTDKGLMVANGVSIKPTSGVFTVVENSNNYEVNFVGKGVASHYTNSKLVSTEEDIDFTFEYSGAVKSYTSTEFTARTVKSKERIQKKHQILF